MRTTADPRTLFREIDGTGLQDAGSYTFNVSQKIGRASIVGEGQEVPHQDMEIEKKTVKFTDYEDDDHEKELALEAIREIASAHLAGTPIDTEYEYDLLFIDREKDDTYLVDTTRFGYHVVSEEDENGEPVAGGYIGIFNEAGLRIR